MYTCVRGIDCFSVSMISFIIIIIINVHVPDQYSERSCIRETIDTSDTCIHDRSLYWSGTCTLIIIIIMNDIIETRGIDCFSISMISFIIIIINNVHVPDQYSERSCIHVSEVSIVFLFLWYLLLLSGTCTLIIIIIMNDIIETEKQSIPLTHV
jgi:hypothetical protein